MYNFKIQASGSKSYGCQRDLKRSCCILEGDREDESIQPEEGGRGTVTVRRLTLTDWDQGGPALLTAVGLDLGREPMLEGFWFFGFFL